MLKEKDLTSISMDIKWLKIYARVVHAITLKEKKNDNRIGSTFRQLHHKVVREKRCVMIVHQRL